MTLDRNSRIPRLLSSVDVRTLPLNAHEAYVLSRIDGASRVDEIALMTGLDEDKAYELLERLVGLGAVEWKDTPVARRGPNSAPPLSQQPVTKSAPTPPSQPVTKSAPVPSREKPTPSYAMELNEDVDLEVDRRHEILDMYRRLDTVSYYEVLGVPRNADKKEIRTAYFELSKRFHPDSLFRKRLGAFKPKMEAIFKKLTEAYEALGKLKTRAQYDEYLALSEQTNEARYMLEAGEQTAEEAKRQSDMPKEFENLPGMSSFPDEEVTLEQATLEVDDRKRLIQERWRKALTHAPSATSNAPSAVRSKSSPAAAGRDLARSLAQVADFTGGVDSVRRHLSSARLAEETGNLVEAVNFARLALALAPERPDIVKEHDRLRLALAAQLADSYAKQAEYEEENGKWQAAAASWAQVCAGRPTDAMAQLRAAEAYRRVGTDLRSAKTFAQKAADLLPNDPAPRILLGRVYLALELKLNAKRELEAAMKMDPSNEVIKTLLNELGPTT